MAGFKREDYDDLLDGLARRVRSVERALATVTSGGGGVGPGPSGDVYTHSQVSSSSTWMISHGLGYVPPALLVTDALGDIIVPDRHDINDNNLTLTFGVPTAGTARMR